jgi:hypothetical protein
MLAVRAHSATGVKRISRLPQFTPDATSVEQSRKWGQGNLQLRGLGTTSTLVLLDGRRIVPANGNGVVDVNVIPASLVESVDIVTGGASAVYGSDAIAGVVNFKLRDDFDGVQLDGGWDVTDQGDGQQYSVGRWEAISRMAAARHMATSVASGEGHPGRREFSAVTLAYAGPGRRTSPGGAFLPLVVKPSRSRSEMRIPSQPPRRPMPVCGLGAPALRSSAAVAYAILRSTPMAPLAETRGQQDPRLVNDRGNLQPRLKLPATARAVSVFARGSFKFSPAAKRTRRFARLHGSRDRNARLPLFVPATYHTSRQT